MACSRVCTTSLQLVFLLSRNAIPGRFGIRRRLLTRPLPGSPPLRTPQKEGPTAAWRPASAAGRRWACAQWPWVSLGSSAAMPSQDLACPPACGPTYAQAMQPSDQNQTFKAPINQIQICPQLQQPLVSLQSGHFLIAGLAPDPFSPADGGQGGTRLSVEPTHTKGLYKVEGAARRWGQTTRPPLTGARAQRGAGGRTRPQLSSRNQDPQCRPGSRREAVTTRVPGGPPGDTSAATAPRRWWQWSAQRQAPPGLLLWDSQPCRPQARGDS